MSRVSIKPTDVGKRVTLQFFDEGGTRREVVGVLERTEISGREAILYVRRSDDSLTRVPLGKIRAGRVVGPASR